MKKITINGGKLGVAILTIIILCKSGGDPSLVGSCLIALALCAQSN